eukprot:SAG31_NODE_27269_length_429_cov_0.503030_1_plen_136_part_10
MVAPCRGQLTSARRCQPCSHHSADPEDVHTLRRLPFASHRYLCCQVLLIGIALQPRNVYLLAADCIASKHRHMKIRSLSAVSRGSHPQGVEWTAKPAIAIWSRRFKIQQAADTFNKFLSELCRLGYPSEFCFGHHR